MVKFPRFHCNFRYPTQKPTRSSGVYFFKTDFNDFHLRKDTCNTADHILMVPDALHHSAIVQGYNLKAVFPIAARDQKILSWCLHCGKALCSKFNIFSQRTSNFSGRKNIRTHPKKWILQLLEKVNNMLGNCYILF